MKLFFLIFCFAFNLTVSAQAEFDHSHKVWDEHLRKHVENDPPTTWFDYTGSMKDLKTLDQYLKSLEAVSQKEFNAWSRDQRLAFLINAYNAFTVKWILKHYPVTGIKKTALFSPWKKKFFTILGKEAHLDHIEKTLIIPVFNEPRIHFAVNCASIGCPPLRKGAFTAKNLEAQLEEQTILFLSDQKRNYYDAKKNKLYLSKIFSWYSEDFEKTHGSVEQFVAEYFQKTKTPIAKDKKSLALIRAKKVSLDDTDYDWDLNDTRSPKRKK